MGLEGRPDYISFIPSGPYGTLGLPEGLSLSLFPGHALDTTSCSNNNKTDRFFTLWKI